MFWRKPSIRQLLQTVINQQEKIMSGIDDLKAAVQKIADDLTAEQAVIQEVIAALQAGGLSDADAEALAVKLQGSAGNIESATASLTAALPPKP